MKITLDQETLATAVINHLRSVGVQSDILGVDFRYTRVPYTVFAEVELIEAKAPKPAKMTVVVEPPKAVEPNDAFISYPPPVVPLVDPATLTPEDTTPDEPPPEMPAAPLFGGGA
jgi:hypothetical protein